MIIAVVIIILFFFISSKKMSSIFTKKKTEIIPSSLYSQLKSEGLNEQAARLAVAHSCAESFVSGYLKSYNFNFWNFASPSYWESGDSPFAGQTIKVPRADEVGFTVGFKDLPQAVKGYLYMLSRSRESAYRELISSNPDVDRFCKSLCPGEYGDTGNDYAGACKTNYIDNIKYFYEHFEDII